MKHKKYLIISFFLIAFTSCTKDFLDVKNTQYLFTESYVTDLSTMKDYVNGVYFRLSISFETGQRVSSYVDLLADNLRPRSTTSSSNTAAQYYWSQTATGGMNTFWKDTYLNIRMCSFVIDSTDEYRNENPAKANDLKGQALAVRALLYFKMINVFAQPYGFTADASHPGVPYITTDDITQPYTRQTVKEVYDGMITDLETAIELLPAVTNDTRNMNRNAAKALLARIYLLKEDYVNAKTLALEVANVVPLMPIAAGYPDAVFKFLSPANTEALFQLSPFTSSDFLNYHLRAASSIRFVATNDIASILIENTNDVRKSWVTRINVLPNTQDTMAVTKFPSNAAPEANPAVTVPEVAYYPSVLRSSEMFLTVAEAAAKTNDETTARTYLNAIRKRANPTIADVIATGQPLLDSIYKERRKELAFENLRMFDLLRWKKGVTRIDALPGAPTTLAYPNDKAIAPIPADEVTLAGIPQNPSY